MLILFLIKHFQKKKIQNRNQKIMLIIYRIYWTSNLELDNALK